MDHSNTAGSKTLGTAVECWLIGDCVSYLHGSIPQKPLGRKKKSYPTFALCQRKTSEVVMEAFDEKLYWLPSSP